MAVVKTPCTAVYPNTTMFECRVNGVLKAYEIHPVDGYVIHNNEIDVVTEDTHTGEEISREPWYSDTYTSVRWDYDFEANPNNIYAILRSQVNEDCILDIDSDHEVMSEGDNNETI